MRTLATLNCRLVEDTQPGLSTTSGPDGLRVALHGRWTAESLSAPHVWARVQKQLQPVSEARAHRAPAVWDVSPVQRLDHTGAQALWNAWGRHWPDTLHAEPVQKAVLERVVRFSVPPPQPERRSVRSVFLALGRRVSRLGYHATGAVRLVGQLLLDLVQVLRHPLHAPWRDVSGHLYRIGATALPITALVGFLIGVVLAYLMSKQLRQFGADSFIVNILGLALIRELGPVLAAILVAGRSGSAITAQIGVMRVTEELDAMRVMGIPKGFRLVMPRTLAMAVAMPLVTVWTTLAAMLGGMLAADLAMGLTPAYFFSALPKTVNIANLWLAVGKSCVFGVLIALIACYYGLRVKPDTQSLGEGTTASVVSSITMVILVDALFAVIFKSVGV
jgi:phospholipid/cholesterol/gamma-HCH transport system permease protein